MSNNAVARACGDGLTQTMSDGLTSVAVSQTSGADLHQVVYASDQRAREIEELQQTLGEGPAITALRQRRPIFRNTDDRSAWPAEWTVFLGALDPPFTGCICASPVQFGAVRMGVLTVSGPPTPLSETIVQEVLTTSDSIGHILLDGWLQSSDQEPHDAARFDLVVHQATGMVSVQLAVPLQSALLALRGAAFSSGLSMSDISRQVVRRERRFTAEGSHLVDHSLGDKNGEHHG